MRTTSVSATLHAAPLAEAEVARSDFVAVMSIHQKLQGDVVAGRIRAGLLQSVTVMLPKARRRPDELRNRSKTEDPSCSRS